MVQQTEDRWERTTALHHLTKTDLDPRVWRRAQALLLVEEGHSQASAARLLHTSAYRVHVWQERFAAEGRAALVDRPRGGCPYTLSDADRALLEEALEQGPQAYDLLAMTVWSIRDLQALLAPSTPASATGVGSPRPSSGAARPSPAATSNATMSTVFEERRT